MNTKHNLVISGIIGGVIGSLLTALLVSPVTAQKDKFGAIECTKLTVVDAEGRSCVVLSTDVLQALSKDDPGVVKIFGNSNGGGILLVNGIGTIPTVYIGTDNNGGFVSVNGTDFYHRDETENIIPAMAKLGVGPKGGLVEVNNRHARVESEVSPSAVAHWIEIGNKSKAILGANEHGGFVVTVDKDGKPQVE